ncbi:MAG: STT3 domain-containing protein, partial [Nitrososphaerota archaeon]
MKVFMGADRWMMGLLQRPTLSRSNYFVVLALILIFSGALIIRVYPAKYGFYLNEYDPYYNYYATMFIVQNAERHGLGVILSDDPSVNYFLWRDYKTWYPEGRAVAASSQSGLHFAGALLYLLSKHIFGLNTSLYDFLVLFPVFLGALTTLVVYLLVKRFAGTIGGLFAALMVAFSPPMIVRGNLGWFKSEPFAIFLALLATYLLLSAIDSKALSLSFVLRALAAGLLLGYSHTAWGGAQFFSLVLGIFLILVPFLNVNLERAAYLSAILVPSTILVSSSFPRPGVKFVTSPIGLLFLGGLFFVAIALIIKRITTPKNYI